MSAAGAAEDAPRTEFVGTLDRVVLILKRWRWLIGPPSLVVPVVAIAVSLSKPVEYAATAQVLFDRPDVTSYLVPGQANTVDPQRATATLEGLARLPLVAHRVLLGSGLSSGRTTDEFLANSSVSSRKGADLLRFTVTDRSPVVAQRLATEYARVFTRYRHGLDMQAFETARAGAKRRLAQLAAAGQKDSQAYATLADKAQQLASLQAIQSTVSLVVQPAPRAQRVGPHPIRTGVIALVVGIAFVSLIAFLAEALDTRVRDTAELEQRLGRPVLAHVPLPRSSDWRRQGPLPMLGDPSSLDAEAFRMLRTSFDFVNRGYSARTVLITSFVEEEGKSYIAANLALAASQAGRRVVVVDLDGRRPSLHRLFEATGYEGIVEVAAGAARLADALVQISPQARPLSVSGQLEGAGGDRSTVIPLSSAAAGSLRLLPLGRARPLSPGEFVGSDAVAQVLGNLKLEADLVLIDSPPLLPVSDAMTLSGMVDALMLVSRKGVVRRPMITAVRRALDTSGVPILGIVVTGVSPQVASGYVGGYRAEFGPEGSIGASAGTA